MTTTTMTTIATAVATGDHDTPLFAESRLYRQVQRIYLVPVSGVEEDKERKRKRGHELDVVETFSCVVFRRDSLT